MANSGRSVLLLLIGFALGAVVANLLFWPFHDGHHDVDGAAETAETESNRLADVALRHDVRSITRQTTLAWTSTAKVETTWSTTSTTPKPASTTASTIAITTTRALASHLQLIYSPEDQRKLAIPDSAKWTVSHGHYGPIVDKKHKLVFCSIPKAACTIWRQLLRRLNGADDYDTTDERITHHYGGKSSGLTYLAAFSDEEANAIMTNPEYVKVAVVRNPYTRILSAWRDKFGPGEAHNWGKIPWTSFVKSRLGSTCQEEEHWAAMSCFCGLRRWHYDYIAKMEGQGMETLLRTLVVKGHIPAEMVVDGWGKGRNESFLGSNRVFHRTDSDQALQQYYARSAYPGVLDTVAKVVAEDVVRFKYQQEEQALWNASKR